MAKPRTAQHCCFQLIMCAVLVSVLSSRANAHDLKLGFYSRSCPQAEKIVSDYVTNYIRQNPKFVAALLRMQFHDCFVRGCDASILLDSTFMSKAEKEALPNLSIKGFDIIDKVKELVEAQCPGVVSCADILALTSRDAVVTVGGPYWDVPTGRRDGLVSSKDEADIIIPQPKFNFGELRGSFASKGLDVKDLVVLSGAHTIGVSHCPPFSNRLYNFTGKGDTDPSMDRDYVNYLKYAKCRTPTDNTTEVEMDPDSFTAFDLSYYKNLLKRRVLFESDTALTTDGYAMSVVFRLLSSNVDVFFKEFGASMEKMISIDVLTGSAGEIRKKCTVVNNC